MMEDDIEFVQLVSAKKEAGQFSVKINQDTVCPNYLVVCPVGVCIAHVNKESQRIMELDEEEFLGQKW